MQFLIYNTLHWFDKLSAAEQLAKNIDGKFDSRYRKGDIVEVRPDGFWIDSKGNQVRGWRKDVFTVVEITDMGEAEAKSIFKPQRDEVADAMISRSQYKIEVEKLSVSDMYVKVTKTTSELVDKDLTIR